MQRDRKRYAREYMRKRRADGKCKPSPSPRRTSRKDDPLPCNIERVSNSKAAPITLPSFSFLEQNEPLPLDRPAAGECYGDWRLRVAKAQGKVGVHDGRNTNDTQGYLVETYAEFKLRKAAERAARAAGIKPPAKPRKKRTPEMIARQRETWAAKLSFGSVEEMDRAQRKKLQEYQARLRAARQEKLKRAQEVDPQSQPCAS